MSEEEKEAIKYLKKHIIPYNDINGNIEFLVNDVLLNLIDKLQKEIEKYKRLAKANLKDSQEFQDNMCNHRCIKNNEVLELKAELQKKDKVIDLMAEVIEECRQNDVIEFNENIDLSEIAGENRIKEYFYEKAEEENE